MDKQNLGKGTEKYLKPEMEVVELETESVIITSCDTDQP